MSITVIEWNRLITVLMTARSLMKQIDGGTDDMTMELENLRAALGDAGDQEALTGPQWRALARPFQIG